MALAAGTADIAQPDAQPDAQALKTAERLKRIAWLVAHTWHVAPASLARKPRFDPEAMVARMVAVAIGRSLLQAPLSALAAEFGDNAEAMAACCNRIAERCERDEGFRTTYRFIRAACASALGLVPN